MPQTPALIGSEGISVTSIIVLASRFGKAAAGERFLLVLSLDEPVFELHNISYDVAPFGGLIVLP